MNTADRELAARPALHVQKGHSRRVRQGHPWVYSNEIVMDETVRCLAPGTLVTLIDAGAERLGVATFNPHALIAARLLTRDAERVIDQDFLAERLERARALRDWLYGTPYYRLIHAEADGLPGLTVDRYDDVLVCQINSAGMECLSASLSAALQRVFSPRAIVLRRDGRVRRLEGLEQTGESIEGALDGPIPVIEHGVRFLADPLHGQKTGWYFDQRDNRRFIAGLASGRSVLDLYCHTGGFALAAAAAGARLVNAFDSSEPALALARTAAGLGSHETAVSFTAGEAFAVLAEQADSGLRYDLVIADPPSFVKSRKDLPQGLRAYRKLARLAARLVKKDGVLFLASCSHQVEEAAFLGEVAHGLRDAGRDARIIRRAGASADHPVHPALPESDYLKAVVLALD